MKKKNNHWQFKCSPLIPVSPKGRGVESAEQRLYLQIINQQG